MSRLPEIVAAAAAQSGIRLPADRVADAVERLTERGGKANGSERLDDVLVRKLIDALTVKESYFLRQPAELRVLDWPRMLAQARAQGRDRIRVWSAACANGEEPYTLAMLASDAFAPRNPPVDVLGTDIAASALARAEAGVYGAQALRRLDDLARSRFFEPAAEGHAVAGRLRSMVRFGSHNLARDPYPPVGERPFDLIVCRNVLIYFEPFALEHVARWLPRALAPGGRLVLGAADRLCLSREALHALRETLSARAPQPLPLPRPRRKQPPARARARSPRPSRDVTDPLLAGALQLADEGDLEQAAAAAQSVVDADPMNAPAHFVCGTLALAAGDATGATRSMRAALYADPAFAAAAFQLGRAFDALGDGPAARNAYRRALEGLEAGPSRYPWLLEDVDAADLAVACATRLSRD